MDDLCLSCSVTGKSLHVSAWDVRTGVVHRVYSVETSSSEDVSTGRACLCVLGRDYILCSSPTLPIIYVWNSTKEQSQMKIACSGVVLALAGSPDGTFCAGAISDKVYIWEVCNGFLVGVASLHYQPVRVLQFTDDGVHLLSGGDDCRVVVWKVARVLADTFDSSGSQLPCTLYTPTTLTHSTPPTRHVWSHHSQAVTSMHCGRGGHSCRVVTASLDQTCKVYELSSGNLLCSILFDFGLTAVTMDTNKHFLFVGGSSGQISQVNLFVWVASRSQGVSNTSDEESSHLSHFIGHSKPITGLTVSTQGHQLVSSSHEDIVRVWDTGSRQTIREVKLKGPVSAMAKAGLCFNLTKPSDTPSSWWTPPSMNIMPFMKQLRSKGGEEGSKVTCLNFKLRKSIDPLCDLDTLKDLDSTYSLPAASKLTTESLAEHRVKQELSEVKEVNKKLYKFMMEQLFEPSQETSTET